jgi:hypothetical protein
LFALALFAPRLSFLITCYNHPVRVMPILWRRSILETPRGDGKHFSIHRLIFPGFSAALVHEA